MGIQLTWLAHGTRFAAAFLIVLLSAYQAVACDTPVYRYAMYRWMPAPYELYYFCDGPLDEAGTQLRARVQETVGASGPTTNLKFIPVDLQQDRELATIPPDVKEVWAKRTSQQLPWSLLLTPMQQPLLEGGFAASDFDALIQSPARQEIGRLLEEGNAGVYVLIGGEDTAATELAEKTVREVVADIASGKAPLAAAPNLEGESLPATTVQLGVVKVNSADPAEKWFVQSLLLLEPDLATSQEPRLFLIYGRGRALFSSLGKGIHRDNLIMDIEFISGACSCTVKEQNPGVDLLMRYDWDAVAKALSDKFGSEEGSPYRFSGDALFPELVIPMESVPADLTAATPDDPSLPMDAAPSTSSDAASAVVDKVENVGPLASASGSDSKDPASPPTSNAAETTTVATPTPSSESVPPKRDQPDRPTTVNPATVSPAQSTSPWSAVIWVGVGLLGTLVVLFGATFLVLRPR